MQAVTVTIGRNVGDQPLSLDEWHQFAFATREAVADAAPDRQLWTATHYRNGTWNGHPEEAAIYFAPVSSGAAVAVLRQRLATLATYYRQEAIGLAVGDAELVQSFPDPAPEARAA